MRMISRRISAAKAHSGKRRSIRQNDLRSGSLPISLSLLSAANFYRSEDTPMICPSAKITSWPSRCS